MLRVQNGIHLFFQSFVCNREGHRRLLYDVPPVERTEDGGVFVSAPSATDSRVRSQFGGKERVAVENMKIVPLTLQVKQMHLQIDGAD